MRSTAASITGMAPTGARAPPGARSPLFTQTLACATTPSSAAWFPASERGASGLSDRKEALYRDLAARNTTLQGVRELLAWLDEQGVPRAVVTSAPRANLNLILDALRLWGSFQALVAEEDATKGKPSPRDSSSPRVGTNPARCIVVEDAPRAGGGEGRRHARRRRHDHARRGGRLPGGRIARDCAASSWIDRVSAASP